MSRAPHARTARSAAGATAAPGRRRVVRRRRAPAPAACRRGRSCGALAAVAAAAGGVSHRWCSAIVVVAGWASPARADHQRSGSPDRRPSRRGRRRTSPTASGSLQQDPSSGRNPAETQRSTPAQPARRAAGRRRPAGTSIARGTRCEDAWRSTAVSDRLARRRITPGRDPAGRCAQARQPGPAARRRRSVSTHDDRRTGARPAIAVGQLIDPAPRRRPYELYLVFACEHEEETLDQVAPLALVGGVALVLLLGAIAWLVTRQVVTPGAAGRAASPSGWPRAGWRSGCRSAARTTWPGSAASFNEMAASLQRQIHQLEELSRVQRRFVSDVSHELRTPLTTVRMAADVLYERAATSTRRLARSAELLQTQLDRFEALLADLLEISRFDAGAAVLEPEPVDLREIVDRVVDDVRAAGRAPRHPRRASRLPDEPCDGRGRPPAGGADPAQPAGQRHRARRGPRRAWYAWPPTRTRWRSRVRDHGVGLQPGEASHGLQPVLAGRPGPGPHHRRHRPRPGDRAGGRAAARRLAAGLGRAGRGRAVPADPAPAAGRFACAGRRCRWCPRTPPAARARSPWQPPGDGTALVAAVAEVPGGDVDGIAATAEAAAVEA